MTESLTISTTSTMDSTLAALTTCPHWCSLHKEGIGARTLPGRPATLCTYVVDGDVWASDWPNIYNKLT